MSARSQKKKNAKFRKGNLNPSLHQNFVTAFDSSPNLPAEYQHEFFAIVFQSIDGDVLKIFDTQSSSLRYSYSSKDHPKFVSLCWGYTSRQKISGKRKGKSNESKPSVSQEIIKMIAIGCHNGDVILFIPSSNTTSILTHPQLSSLSDFIFSKNCQKGYSCDADGTLVEWDIETCQVRRKWKSNIKNTLKLNHFNDQYLAVAGHSIELWNLETHSLIRTFPGLSVAISQLLFSFNGEYFLTLGKNARFVHIWSTESNDLNEAALVLDQNVKCIDLTPSGTILALKKNGTIELWDRYFKKMTKTKQPHSTKFSIRSPDSSIIPILSACFSPDSKQIVIARGTQMKPEIETIKLYDDGQEALPKEIVIERSSSSDLLKPSHVNGLHTSHQYSDKDSLLVSSVPDDAFKFHPRNHMLFANSREITPSENSLSVDTFVPAEPTLETKVKKLSSSIKDTKTLPLQTEMRSLVTALSQAIKTNDAHLLKECIKIQKWDVIENSVKQLPINLVIPFLKTLITQLQEKDEIAVNVLPWLQSIIYVHLAYLITVPSLIQQISRLYQTIESHVANFNSLVKLKGRLDLISHQIERRRGPNSEKKAWFTFEENDLSGSELSEASDTKVATPHPLHEEHEISTDIGSTSGEEDNMKRLRRKQPANDSDGHMDLED